MKKDDIIMTSVFAGIGILFAIFATSVESTVATWGWWILSVCVIAFTIYVAIDAIVKNKRKPKSMADLLIKAFEERAKSPEFAERMTKCVEEGANRREVLFLGQRTEEEDYGYSPENPIMTSTIHSTDEYLKALRSDDGEMLTWERLGSQCMPNLYGIEAVMIDRYQLYKAGQEYKIIYICPYGHQSHSAPKGMIIV